ncbi:hypothetical protein FSP39_005562 [Pinctada imbricata]|uniref:Uncharacterized protein n=1 Tax=Pinctada imbricata TaxID=66713 RepID=A0AA89C379_PINIB|nr:hypothetical protein FSP39_005562 [Pinctada imbricata]
MGKRRKRSIVPDDDRLNFEHARNRWEVQKILAAADRAKAHAKAEPLDSPASQSMSLNTFRSFRKFVQKEKKEPLPTRLLFGTNVLVLHMNDEAANKEKKEKKRKKKAKKVNGWYVMGEEGDERTRSPLSWKDILEQPMRDPTMYSEYGRNPTGAILPSRVHRQEAEEILEQETSKEALKEKMKNK